jgi:hypothetical protein
MDIDKSDQYSPEETAERFHRAVKRSLNMPHAAQRVSKLKKRGRPRKRKLTPRK